MSFGNRRLIIVVAVTILLGGGYLREAIWGQSPELPPSIPFVVPYFAPPDRIELCGEAVPLDMPEVRERLDREFSSGK